MLQFLDNYWNFIEKLTEALAQPDVKAEIGSGFAKSFEDNANAFKVHSSTPPIIASVRCHRSQSLTGRGPKGRRGC